ncbi:hypothetical protein Q1695_009990 [Nippostrongylus brasiliensis]|nr:hypothetical protein Q1695_009990 [Nippostrongylus brasiliensis]
MLRNRINQDNPLIAIACGQFSLSLMQTMFMFYYVKVYLNIFHVPTVWFNIAQAMFMFWNAINDPLFGYLQDKPGSWLNSRTRVIRSFAPFLVTAFMFMWVPWSEGSPLEGLHLIISLFLYDAFYSAVGVSWSALFADSTREPRLRVSAMKYSQISILASVNIIAITEKLSHSLERFWAFQLVTIVVAFIGLFCFMVAGSLRAGLPYSVEKADLLENEDGGSTTSKRKEVGSMWVATKEIFCESDFIAIIAANFIHTARSVAHMNFASTATELLIPQAILPKGSLQLSLFYGVVTLGPQILLILCEQVVVRNGAYRILMTSYALSVLSGLVFFFITNPYLLMVFMFIDSITVHSAAPLFNIVISDFIDDDAKRHSRRSGLSSLVFSLNALIVKPAQSVAPVLIVYILNSYGYSEYIATKESSETLKDAMRTVLLATPVVLGGLQYCFVVVASQNYTMILSTLMLADKIKAAVPCSLLSFSMVPFATVSLGIGAASWFVPRKTTQALDNTLYRAYMRLCLFVFENLSGVQVKLYGDVRQLMENEESVLVLSNHQSDVDWAVLVMLAFRQGIDGSEAGFRVMVKHVIHYVPLFGWYIFQHGYIYVRRFGEFLSAPVLKQLAWLDSLDEKFWLLVFPEGTRYSVKRPENIELSREFCRRKGIPELKNVLCPRAGGIFMALERLETLDAVYDVTIGYGQTRLPNRRGLAPNMFEFCCGGEAGRTLSVHVKRYPAGQLPKTRKELQEWAVKAYEEKDKLMDQFYETGEFPDPVSLYEPSASIRQTLPPTLFFAAALVAPFYIPAVRKAYFWTVASSPFLILWLEARKCA